MHYPEPEKLLANWQDYDLPFVERPSLLKRFTSIGSNQSFLVSADGERWVVRINKDADKLGIDRKCEFLIHQKAAEVGLAPTIKYFSPRAEILVTRYVLGRNFSPSVRNPVLIDGLIDRVKLIHQIQADLPNFDYRRHLKLLDPKQTLGETVDAALDVLEVSAARTLCHHDLTPENILLTHQGPVFIDWEYAGRGFAALDFATLICDGGVSQEQVVSRTNIDKEVMQAACLVYRTLCDNWAARRWA